MNGKSKREPSMRQRLAVTPGRRVQLTAALAESTPGITEKEEAETALKDNRKRLADLQYQLFADGRWGVLVVLQAMDCGGKDGTIRHVVTAFDPQGCSVTSFKVPTAIEAKHDFLWRVHKAAPGRGHIGVFNRSHYEDVLVVRVHNLVAREIWDGRYQQICEFERILAANDIRVLKFLLHISKDEQKRRLEARLRDERKQWKFDPGDLEKRGKWDAYMAAYEDAVERCSTEWAPWYVVPSDRKWYRDYAVSQILRETLEDLPLEWPRPKYDPARIRVE